MSPYLFIPFFALIAILQTTLVPLLPTGEARPDLAGPLAVAANQQRLVATGAEITNAGGDTRQRQLPFQPSIVAGQFLDLGSLAIGDYVVEVRASGGAAEAIELIPFRITG